MTPDPMFSELPDREDMGVDEDYQRDRFLRAGFACLFSSPIWALIAYVVYLLTR